MCVYANFWRVHTGVCKTHFENTSVCVYKYVHTTMFTKGFVPVEIAFSEIQSLNLGVYKTLAGGVRLQGDMSYVDHEDATRIDVPCH